MLENATDKPEVQLDLKSSSSATPFLSELSPSLLPDRSHFPPTPLPPPPSPPTPLPPPPSPPSFPLWGSSRLQLTLMFFCANVILYSHRISFSVCLIAMTTGDVENSGWTIDEFAMCHKAAPHLALG